MATPLPISSPSFVNLTILEELTNVSESVSITTRTLCENAQPPIDAACLLFVCRGAQRAFGAALELLREPNEHAISIDEQLKELVCACQQIYAERQRADAYETLKRRLHANPGWAALAKLGSLSSNVSSGFAAAIGVNLALALAGKKLLAVAYMHSLRKCLPGEPITPLELLDELPTLIDLSTENWPRQLTKFLPDFWACFDSHEHPPPPPKTVHEKITSEWKGRAAFPSYRRRAAVLDKTCLSARQIDFACQWSPLSGFRIKEEYQLAEWLIGFSGANVESVHRIPIMLGSANIDDTWVIRYDVDSGLLLRDYSVLAADTATMEGRLAEPASYVFALPIPLHLAHYIRNNCLESEHQILDFGDLVTGLRNLTPEGTMFPSHDELKPSWARWNRTVGPFLRQMGIDSLVAGLLVGDIGMSARSKLYYARVHAHEIWAAATLAYARMGLGVPVQMSTNQIAFGSRVTPSSAAILDIDIANVTQLNSMKPGRRSTLPDEIAFHNMYSAIFGFRLMVRLSLRAAASIGVSASVDERWDTTIDLIEKSRADRKGGMAALLTSTGRKEIALYKSHCRAMLRRLKNNGQFRQVTQWLEAVVNNAEVPLLMRIDSSGATIAMSTRQVLDVVCSGFRLAEDFGRKWNENALRAAGCRTADIDRTLRHEVAGQEAVTSVSDGSEAAWVRRIAALLDDLHLELFPSPLQGLRKE